MISYCYHNSSTGYTEIDTMVVAFSSVTDFTTFITAMGEVQKLIRLGQGSFYNCYYTITNPVEAAQYNKKFSLTVILFNILFNLGYMYTASKFLITYYTSATPSTADSDLTKVGKNWGSLLVRFIYSKFVPKTYYTFM